MAREGYAIDGRELGALAGLFDRFPRVFAGRLGEALDLAGQLVETEAATKTAPEAFTDRTGNLRASIQHEALGGHAVVIWPGMEYGIHVELGTRDEGKVGQRIFPKAGKALAWPGPNGGGMIVRRWSTVGKRRPRPFMRPALENRREEILRVFADVVDLVLAEVGP